MSIIVESQINLKSAIVKDVLIIEGKQRQWMFVIILCIANFMITDSQLQTLPDLHSSYVLEGPLWIPSLEFFAFLSLN